MQGAADRPVESGAVQEDARALVLAGPQLRFTVVLVGFQIALAAQAPVAVLPVGIGQRLDDVVEMGAVVVVGQERAVAAAAVVGTALDGALAGGGAERATSPR